jgi:hypothetical protein
MTEFSLQGDLSIAGTVLATGSSALPLTKVITLSFNNPLAYILTLEKYDALTTSTIVLYEVTLAAGDTINDTLVYVLNAGDTLTAYSNILGTTYYIYGIDYASN